MTRLIQVVPYVAIIAGGIALYALANHIAYTPIPDQIGPEVWPKIILTLLIGVSAVAILQKLLPRSNSKRSEGLLHIESAEELVADHGEQRPMLVAGVLVSTFIYLLVLETTGFFLSTMVFAAALMIFGGFRRPAWIAGLAVGIALFFTFVFMKIVFVALPIGSEPFSKVSLAVMTLLGIH